MKITREEAKALYESEVLGLKHTIVDKIFDYVEELEAKIANNSPELVHDVNVTICMENTQLKEKLNEYENKKCETCYLFEHCITLKIGHNYDKITYCSQHKLTEEKK